MFQILFCRSLELGLKQLPKSLPGQPGSSVVVVSYVLIVTNGWGEDYEIQLRTLQGDSLIPIQTKSP